MKYSVSLEYGEHLGESDASDSLFLYELTPKVLFYISSKMKYNNECPLNKQKKSHRLMASYLRWRPGRDSNP